MIAYSLLLLAFSADYDAPLSEAGDITEKYLKTRQLILDKIYKPLGEKQVVFHYDDPLSFNHQVNKK